MATLSFTDACAALMAGVVIAQSLTLGAIQGLRIRDSKVQDMMADSEVRRYGLSLPVGITAPGTWLLLLLLLAAAMASGDLLRHLGLALYEHWLSPIHGGALLLVGPAIWFYAVAITRLPSEPAPSWHRFAWHAVPAGMMASALVLSVVLDPWNDAPGAERRTWSEVLSLMPVATQILLYLGAVVRRVRRQTPRLEERFSSVEHRRLRWLEVGAWTFALLVLVWIASWTLPVALSNILTNGLLAVDVAVLGIFGSQQRNVFAVRPWLGEAHGNPHPERHGPQVATEVAYSSAAAMDGQQGNCAGSDLGIVQAEVHPAKYAKSAIPEAVARQIADRLARYVEVDKPYLECNLTLGELASAVNATPHQLSQVLSTQLGLSFFDYVNRLRVEAVKATLARPQSVGRPLLEIALECGFGSKSAFNDAFKRATGMSPSAYRKSLPAAAATVAPHARREPEASQHVQAVQAH